MIAEPNTMKNHDPQLKPAYLLIGFLLLIATSCGQQARQVEEAETVAHPDTLMAPDTPAPVEEETAAPVEAVPKASKPDKVKQPQVLQGERAVELDPQAVKSAGSIGSRPGATGKPRTTQKPDEQVYGGQMMVYASDSMIEHRVERVMALVQQQIDPENTIRDFSRSMGISEAEVAGDSKVHDIKLSDSLRVTLVFHPDDFKLISEETVYYRHFAKGYTQYFDWEIEPLSPGDKKLTIKIENYVDNSWNNFVSPQTINIRVKVNQSTLWTRLWDTLQNDPAWLLNKILLPVLAFIAGLLATYIRKKLFGKKES